MNDPAPQSPVPRRRRPRRTADPRDRGVDDRPAGPRADRDPTTRQRLLEAAGPVFAQYGFDRATGKEICERAGANIAAINYHFGGMQSLYAEVVAEAHNRFVTLADLSAAVQQTGDAVSRLEAAMRLVISTLTS